MRLDSVSAGSGRSWAGSREHPLDRDTVGLEVLSPGQRSYFSRTRTRMPRSLRLRSRSRRRAASCCFARMRARSCALDKAIGTSRRATTTFGLVGVPYQPMKPPLWEGAEIPAFAVNRVYGSCRNNDLPSQLEGLNRRPALNPDVDLFCTVLDRGRIFGYFPWQRANPVELRLSHVYDPG